MESEFSSSGKPDRYLGYPRHDFMLGDRVCTVVEPSQPAPGRHWVWRAEFLHSFPSFLVAMLRRGWWVGFVNVGNTFGCPAAMRCFDAFYREMTVTHGFHPRPVIEGMSRGGLYVYNWAARNPDKVGLIYGDNPVCDFKSWPGGKGKGPGSPPDWTALQACYGFSSEAEALAWPDNPVDNLGAIIKAGIPMAHVFGDADEIVPWEDNTGVLSERVRAQGGNITLFRKPGSRHHPHGPEDAEAFADWVQVHALDGERRAPCITA